MIEWYKTSKREDTQLADRRVWRSKCGHYRVEESTIRYGNRTDRHGNHLGYPTFYRAMVLKDFGWDILSYHRKRGPAVASCEYFHEHGHPKPPKTKKRKKVRRAGNS